MNSSIQKFNNQYSLEQFLNQMKLQIFNKEFDELCKVSQESIQEVINKDSQDVPKKESNGKSPQSQGERRKINKPKSLLNKRKNSETEVDEEILLQLNSKHIKQDQNQLIQTTEETEKENSVNTNQTDQNEANKSEISLNGQNENSPYVNTQNSVQNISVHGRPRIIQPIYIFLSNEQIGYVEVDIMDENAMKNIAELLQNHSA